MSYEAARRYLNHCRERAEISGQEPALLDAVEELATAIEADMTQIKAALSHIAHLLERQVEDALPERD